MSFFLLGRTTDGTLALLSDEAYSSRQDALAELSRLTSDPEFDGWDTEVLVLDIDTGTPVLLVRPAGAHDAGAETPETGAEPEATAEHATPEHDAALAAVLQDLEDGESAELEPAATPAELEAASASREPESTATAEEEEPAVASDEEPDATPVAEDAFVAEAAEEPVLRVDDEWAAAVEESAENDQSLKDALLRTAAQMEAQGISAPESVGPAADDAPEAAIEPISETVVADVSPEEEVPVEQEAPVEDGVPAADESQESVLVGDEPLDAEVTVPVEDSEPVPASDSRDDAETVQDESPGSTADDTSADAGPAWPWDDSPETVASPLAGLEEPDPDAESMIRALADDEASRTVVLGEYESAPVAPIEPELIVSAAAIAQEAAAEKATAEAELAAKAAAAEADEPGENQPGEEPVVGDEGDKLDPDAGATQGPAESDFIDLGEVAPPPPKGYEPGKPDIEGMTCDDCVYVDSCPNKDEREPATCGSFQWK